MLRLQQRDDQELRGSVQLGFSDEDELHARIGEEVHERRQQGTLRRPHQIRRGHSAGHHGHRVRVPEDEEDQQRRGPSGAAVLRLQPRSRQLVPAHQRGVRAVQQRPVQRGAGGSRGHRGRPPDAASDALLHAAPAAALGPHATPGESPDSLAAASTNAARWPQLFARVLFLEI